MGQVKSQMPPGAPVLRLLLKTPVGTSCPCLLTPQVSAGGETKDFQYRLNSLPHSLPRSEKKAQPSCCTLKSSIPGAPRKAHHSPHAQLRPSLEPAPPSRCLIRHKLIRPLPPTPWMEGRHSKLPRHVP